MLYIQLFKRIIFISAEDELSLMLVYISLAAFVGIKVTCVV